ncbi:MAG: hypothetical protein JWO67_3160 [Streptosporangiaceae bacterium]|nr:hypothetical protein [Streptosporangiaceae bacterium]
MLGHTSMRMTTDTYQTVLPEMHTATASASLRRKEALPRLGVGPPAVYARPVRAAEDRLVR